MHTPGKEIWLNFCNQSIPPENQIDYHVAPSTNPNGPPHASSEELKGCCHWEIWGAHESTDKGTWRHLIPAKFLCQVVPNHMRSN
ncbi:aminoglycoside 6-adenylyltransferase [Anopheles sinensis]|uniref:Aminoglycoside 6-adenylyltransferase n=1 Tax=Anopheles sinensis TaxID=74873 RepID=A0A084WS98_ANOSI|nr:aminoglycoside 6-adenylyltransferase [Anopheles sinensis]